MKKFLSKYGAYVIAALVFVLITLVYCAPAFQGKVLSQSDTMQWKGMAHTLKEYNETADVPANWTNSMFSGMPSYQITVKNPGNPVTAVIWYVDQFFRKLATLFFDSIFGLLLGYFIGFFIMLRSFGVNKWLSIVGSIAVSMSSYFFLIIPAGHEGKALTLGMMAPVIGGFFLIFRRKYALGAALVMLYSSIGMMKHPQMSYYLLMMMALFGVAEIYIHVKEKKVKELAIALAIFVGAVGVGVGTGYSTLKANSEYLKETIRGGHSELQAGGERQKGLDIDYATAWSYGVGETMTLMIPNFKGGASTTNVGENSVIYDEIISQGYPRSTARGFAEGCPTYWGEQPFTAGPVYVGAIVCFLFLLGCMVVKGPYKWALLASMVFSVLLSWGHNFMGLTELFFNYFPFYNKFRTVSSILVVAQIAMPLLGFLALNEIIKGNIEKTALKRYIGISAGVTGGLCLVFALFGSVLFDFTSSNDARILAGMPAWFIQALHDQRASMLRIDAFRSFVFIALSAGVLYVYSLGKMRLPAFIGVMGVLVLADMWPVDKRYFGADNWVSQKDNDAYFAMQPYEKQILQDKSYYRVMNLTTNTFNESRTSYYLNSIGGYHAAKLRRYQDIIDAHLTKGNMNVANMLNAKYFIVEGDNGRPEVMVNPDAMGNAWFVDEVRCVDTPREESDALNAIDFSKQAVTDRQFSSMVPEPNTFSGEIALLSYAPDRLVYSSSCEGEKTAIFSDIYYPYGWKAYIDGAPVAHFRVNYVLRALNVPAGEHEIMFEFRPDSIYKGFRVNALFRYIMYTLIISLIVTSVLRELGKGPKWLRDWGA